MPDRWRRSENERFKRAFGPSTAVATVLAVQFHYLLFVALPGWSIRADSDRNRGLEAIVLPPEVEVPPPPEEVVRPALPRVGALDLGEDLTIQIVTFAEAAELPLPPPPEQRTAPADRPPFVPYSLPPALQNTEEIMGLLVDYYPRPLKIAGIGGSVLLWIHIDEHGRVVETHVARSSGFAMLDKAAIRVAEAMIFRPAMNRDRVTDVWLAQPIAFRRG